MFSLETIVTRSRKNMHNFCFSIQGKQQHYHYQQKIPKTNQELPKIKQTIKFLICNEISFACTQDRQGIHT
jgi:hypothetical protein